MPTSRVRQSYLSLLCAADVPTLEDTVVRKVLGVLGELGMSRALPVRLSKVASFFQIEPRPKLVRTTHDGDIQFDDATRRFVIRLRRYGQQDENSAIAQVPKLSRLRFSYAHEFAHRFCFVPRNDTWVRALTLATEDLAPAARMRERITLSQLEEGICNDIARRVLIPDVHLGRYCNIAEWFKRGSGLHRELKTAALAFRVSRECLLVRLQREIDKNRIPTVDRGVILVGGETRGPGTSKGRYVPRVVTAIAPKTVNRQPVERLHPGTELQELSSELCAIVGSCLKDSMPLSGELRVPLHLRVREKGRLERISCRLEGWWRVVGQDAEGQRRRLLIWGWLEPS